MKFDVLTLFPDFFDSPLAESITARAIEKGLFKVRTVNIRDYATDKHKTTDDAPSGGGPGMVMKVEPVARAIESLKADGWDEATAKIILATPQGIPFTNDAAKELASLDRVAVVCGRYEGVDERIRGLVDMEVSVGDFIMTGGEIAALAIIDATSRFIPGVVGGEGATATDSDSFSDGLLEYPQFTRPEEYSGGSVPPVLLSGDHGEIARWRRRESLRRTLERRPGLLLTAELSAADMGMIKEIKEKK